MENFNYKKKRNSPQIRSEKGFSLVLLTTLIPLILAAIVFIYIGTTQIELKTSLHQTCRIELMKAQKVSSNLIYGLMLINKVIDGLKWAFVIGELLEFTVVLASVGAAILSIAEFTAQQIPRIQKLIIAGIIAEEKYFLASTHYKLNGVIRDFKNRAHNLIDISNSFIFTNPLKGVPVEPENPKLPLTKYKLKKNFEDKQQLFFVWKYQLKTSSMFFRWANWNQRFRGGCNTTLKKESPWEPTLYADKFYWRFL